MDAFADGLGALIDGEDGPRRDAALLNLADLLSMWGNYMTDGKWASSG